MDEITLISEKSPEISQAFTPVQELINSFISSQDVKPASREIYRRTLKQFFTWVNLRGLPLSGLSRPDIIEFKEALLSRGLSPLTVASYLTTLRMFYEWAESLKLYPNIARGIRSPKRKQQFKRQPLTAPQATALLNYFEEKSPRDRAIINLLLRTGLRTIEIARANIQDITFKGTQMVLMVKGKGRDEPDNFVILTDKALIPLKAYLSSLENLPGSSPLFFSWSNNSRGERIRTRTISKIAKEGLKCIGLQGKEYTAHSLRHTAGTSILRAGGSLEQAQFTLRHTNPATTQIYTATLTEERRLRDSGEALIDSVY